MDAIVIGYWLMVASASRETRMHTGNLGDREANVEVHSLTGSSSFPRPAARILDRFASTQPPESLPDHRWSRRLAGFREATARRLMTPSPVARDTSAQPTHSATFSTGQIVRWQ